MKRVRSEFPKYRGLLSSELDDVGLLERKILGKVDPLGKLALDSFEYRSDEIIGAAHLLDTTLSDRLQIENIYAMYELQKGVFWFKAMAAVAAIASATAAFVGLAPRFDEIFAAMKKVVTLIATLLSQL